MSVIVSIHTKFLTVQRVSQIFHNDQPTVSRWCRDGKFPNAIKPAQRWLIPESDVVAFLRSGRSSDD